MSLYEQLLEAVKKYNLNRNKISSIYELACAYEAVGEDANAYIYLQILLRKQKIKKLSIIDETIINNKLKEISSRISELPPDWCWYIDEDPFVQPRKVFGTCFTYHDGTVYCAGNMEDWWSAYQAPQDSPHWLQSKSEIHEVETKANQYTIQKTAADSWLVPVMCNHNAVNNEVLILQNNGKQANFLSHGINKYQYFNMKTGEQILFDKPAIIAKPIPMRYDENKKRLVVNIFIDSFNGYLLEQEDYRVCVKNILRYFEKGVICSEAYAGSEFTYPSIPTYMLSLYPEHHQMLDDRIFGEIPNNVKTLAEYFHDEGYTTSKIGGNRSFSPFLGHSRGIDRTVFYLPYSSEQVVADAIEDLEAFKGTNHFLTIDFMDLHHVSSGFLNDVAVHTQTDAINYVEDCTGNTTVKRSYSGHRMEIYKNVLRKLDRNLEMLFHYIEENYSEDEIVISLFSDHGTSCGVHNDRPFLDETRIHVPFMFRAKGFEGECRELIESADYLPIVCSLANVPYDMEKIDGRLPKFFGGESERDYIFARSIYPGDPYRATIIDKTRAFYLITEGQVTPELEYELSDYTIRMDNRKGQDLDDPAFKEKCIEIVKHRKLGQ